MMCLPISFPLLFSTTKPAANCLSIGVPRKFQLYSQLRTLSVDNNSTTGIAKEEEKQGDSKKLSGFDVLRSLEKASAQKMKKKRNGRDHSNSLLSRKKSTIQGRQNISEALVDYGNKSVRELSVKEDWGSRLNELERRLEELVDTTAA